MWFKQREEAEQTDQNSEVDLVTVSMVLPMRRSVRIPVLCIRVAAS